MAVHARVSSVVEEGFEEFYWRFEIWVELES